MPLRGASLKCISPSQVVSSPHTARSSELLPAPLAPMMEMSSPCLTDRLTLWTATMFP
jgi:hypothetical protein